MLIIKNKICYPDLSCGSGDNSINYGIRVPQSRHHCPSMFLQTQIESLNPFYRTNKDQNIAGLLRGAAFYLPSKEICSRDRRPVSINLYKSILSQITCNDCFVNRYGVRERQRFIVWEQKWDMSVCASCSKPLGNLRES